jgi:hypothetical protein
MLAVSLDFSPLPIDDDGIRSGASIMINTQESKFSSESLSRSARALSVGRVMTLGGAGGEVEILSGRVWLTIPGDPSDHVLEAGESFRFVGSGPTLVEAWSRGAPALIAWRPRTLVERLRDRLAGAWGRCWELMNPAGRVGMGTSAALAGIVAAGLLFGPVSEARIRFLVRPAASATVLHNASGAALGATATRGSLADGSDTRDRPSRSAQEARRRAPGAA